jgi:phosphonate transport system permease protein
VAGQTTLDEPRRLTPRWRSLGISLRTIGLVVILVLIYAYGWRATKIDVYQLVTGLPNMRHILAGLLQPDLFVQGTQTIAVETPLRVGAGPKGPSSSGEAGARVVVTPRSVEPGEQIVFEGTGFPGNAEGRLMLGHLTARSRLITQIKTDSTGSFREAFAWPQFAADDYTVQVEVQAALNQWAPSEALQLSLEKIVETVLLALMGTSIGVLLSVPLSFLGARNLMRGSAAGMAIYYVVRTFFNVTRSIEVLIVAVIMAVVVGIGPFAGVMALVVHSIGAMGKLYSEAIESIDPGPIEAITATGATRLQVVRYAVIPQVVPQFVSFTMYRWDINVRMSTVIGLVGGGGIGYLLIQYINLLQWRQAGTALWLIAAVVMVMDYASAEMRERIV